MSSNDLKDMEFISELENLEILNLDQNRVASTENVENCPQLRTLSVRNNALSDFKCIEDLEGSENLQNLSIEGNPLSAVDFVRLRVVSMLPQLSSLEGIKIVSEERVKSLILLGNEHPRRMHTWERHLGIPFVDTVRCLMKMKMTTGPRLRSQCTMPLSRQPEASRRPPLET